MTAVGLFAQDVQLKEIPESLKNPSALPEGLRRQLVAEEKLVRKLDERCSVPLKEVELRDSKIRTFQPQAESHMPKFAGNAPPCETKTKTRK